MRSAPLSVPVLFPGSVWHPIPGCLGLSWGGGIAHPKIVGHSTEGFTIAGAEGAYTEHRSAPHLTADPLLEDIAQHVSLRRAAYSLRNGPNPVQTNRDPFVWQVEIVGQAAHMDELPASAIDWLARAVFGPLCALTGTPTVVEPTHAYPPPDGHQLGREPWRFTAEKWDAYEGIAWHQNVPDSNTHGDPGALDWRRLSDALNHDPSPSPTTPHDGEDDMTAEQLKALTTAIEKGLPFAIRATADHAGNGMVKGRVYVLDAAAGTYYPVGRPTLDALYFVGAVRPDPDRQPPEVAPGAFADFRPAH